jgi:hypothetical protein
VAAVTGALYPALFPLHLVLYRILEHQWQGFADPAYPDYTLQYFPDLPALIRALRPLLASGGEIHILDSPFYSPEAVPAARERTRRYYAELGFPLMASHYHHHSFAGLDPYTFDCLYDPSSAAAHSGDSPFPWIRVYR